MNEDHVLGCILGGAIGDAMGGPYEGMAGPVALQPDSPWLLSDDTQLTLATCEAISERGSVSAEHVATRFAVWFKQRRISGMGASTYQALTTLAHGGHWALSGRKGEMAAGNGAAMRAAPLAFWLDPRQEEDRAIIRDVSRITHHSDEAYAGCLAIILAIRAIIEKAPPDALISAVVDDLPDTRVKDRLLELAELDPAMPLFEVGKRFGCSGHVVESVPFAIHCSRFAETIPFEALLAGAISAGGDTDTIASMVGQIAGARLGFAALPCSLVNRVPDLELVLATARTFAGLVAR